LKPGAWSEEQGAWSTEWEQASGGLKLSARDPVKIRSQPWPRLTANREVRRQPPARGRRSEIRGKKKKVIRDKSPAIPATDGAIDITGFQSQLFVGTNEARQQLRALPKEQRRNIGRRLDALQSNFFGRC